ncbi:MAG: WD40 repeat domain-containing serine/threonine protein kinase [Pirellulales bacterium]
MLWRFWHKASRAAKSRDRTSDSESDYLSVGPRTQADLDHLAKLFFEHGDKLRSIIQVELQHRVVEGSRDSIPVPDFGPPFRTLRHLAAGAMGDVYEAIDDQLARRLAIKVSRLGTSADEALVYAKLLSREQRHLGPLSHDNIVHVYRCGQLPDGRNWYAMEFVPGASLLDYVRSCGLATNVVVRLMHVVSKAIGWLHEQRIVHADLKPGNILVTEAGTPKVIDFGMARVIDHADPESSTPQGPSNASCPGRGTPGYRAPELAARGIADFRTDVYSLGTILHQLLSGDLPDSPHESPPLLPDQVDDARCRRGFIPRSLAAVIGRCRSERPDDRYSDANELAAELERWLMHRPVRAQAGFRPFYRAALVTRRHRWLVASASIAMISLATVLGATHIAREYSDLSVKKSQEMNQERARATRELQRANRERERALNEQQHAAIVATREHLSQRRPDAARGALDGVPASRWSIECDLLNLQIASFPAPTTVRGAHDWGVVHFLTAPGQLVSAGQDGRLLVWNSIEEPTVLRAGTWSQAHRQFLHVLDPPESGGEGAAATSDLAWLKKGQSFVETTLAGEAYTWNLHESKPRQFFEHDRPLWAVATDEAGEIVLLGDDDGTLIACGQNAEVRFRASTSEGAITAIAPIDDRNCWVGHESGVVVVLDLTDGTVRARDRYPSPVWELSVAPDRERLAIGCGEPAVHICGGQIKESGIRRLASLPLPSAEVVPPQAVHRARFASDGNHIYVVDNLGRLVCFDLQNLRTEFVRTDQNVTPLSIDSMQTWPILFRRVSAGIDIIDDGRSLVTAGHDTLIKEWRLDQPPSTRELRVGEQPWLAFDPSSNTLLWAASRDGQLQLIDADLGQAVDLTDSDETIVAFAAAAQQPIVATATHDTIHFWTCAGNKIRAIHAPIKCERTICSLALAPDGQRVAALSSEGALQLWQVANSRKIADRQFPAIPDANVGGRVSFNCTGEQLGVVGAHQATYVLNGETLRTLAEPSLVAGRGGTALAWHPTDDRVLFAGDTVGRVARMPHMEIQHLPHDATGHAPIAAIVATLDERRVVAATSTGRVVIIDPAYWGPLLTLEPRSGRTHSELVDLAISPSGRLLATSYQDGLVSILRIAETELPTAPSNAKWREKIAVQGQQIANLRVRPESISVDRRGAVHALYLRTDSVRLGHEPTWQLVLGSETAQGWHERVVQDIGPLTLRMRDALYRSLALANRDDTLFALAKTQADRESKKASTLTLFRFPLDGAPIPSEVVLPDENDGFDPVIRLLDNASIEILTFSHAGHYLCRSHKLSGRWETEKIGRQGDGFRMQGASTSSSVCHLIFRPTRFNGDRLSPVCLTIDHESKTRTSPFDIRRDVSHQFRATALAVASLPSGAPAVLYIASARKGEWQLVLNRWINGAWTEQVVLPRLPRTFYVANMAGDREGTLHFAARVGIPGDVWLFTIPATGASHIEQLWRDTSRVDEPEFIELVAPLYLDPAGKPVVCVARSSPSHGFLRIFRRP